jgi:dihydroxyacetone kinase
LETVQQTVEAHLQRLGDLDSIAGDGDHGIGMQRGSIAAVSAAQEAAASGAGAGETLSAAADAWADKAGGTSGAIWGLILHELASSLGNQDAPTPDHVSEGLRQAGVKVMDFGGAAPGDKTLVDVLVPFSEAFASAVREGVGLRQAWGRAAKVGADSAEATKFMAEDGPRPAASREEHGAP